MLTRVGGYTLNSLCLLYNPLGFYPIIIIIILMATLFKVHHMSILLAFVLPKVDKNELLFLLKQLRKSQGDSEVSGQEHYGLDFPGQ